MLFVIDIGNTNMEFGIYRSGEMMAGFRLGTNRDITSDEVGLTTMQFFYIHKIDLEMIEDVVISSVVPQVVYSVKNAVRKYLAKEPLIVKENLPVNIVNKYQNPEEVGADRLVTAYAGFRKYGGNLVVIDFGTATTFDVVDQDGAYLGGVIYPGIKISLDALVEKTAKLPKVQIEAPEQVIGKNTITSMQSGIVYGYTGAVMNIVSQIEKQLGTRLTVVATGGLAKMIGKQMGHVVTIDKTLILDGLEMLYQDYKSDLSHETRQICF